MRARNPTSPEQFLSQLARASYWASFLLLVAGAWLLIDPFRRRPGQTVQVYLSVGAFELYIWLLLLLARWQVRRRLWADAGRSGGFSVFLTGLSFMVANELLLAAPAQGVAIDVALVVLLVAKLLIGPRWMGISMPRPILCACAGWGLVLAGPGIAMRMAWGHETTQHVLGYVMSWFVAVAIGLHVLLVGWQARRGLAGAADPMGRWWIPWVPLGGLAGLGVAQVFVTMWGFYMDWAAWYFTPIAVSAGVVALALSYAAGRARHLGWLAMAIAAVVAVGTLASRAPARLPETWTRAFGQHRMLPLYASGMQMTVLLVLVAAMLHRAWMLVMAGALPVLAGVAKGVERLLNWTHGLGAALFLGAFALLGVGGWLQWCQGRRPPERGASGATPPPPAPSAGQGADGSGPLNPQ